MNEDFLRWVGEKKVGRLVFVSLSVCVFKHFRTWRPNGWSDRDWGATDRRTHPPERRWRRCRVDRRHVARGTCRRVKVCKKLLTHLQVEQEEPPIRNWQVTRTLPQPVCFCGCRSCGVQASRARGGKLFWHGVLR